MNQRLYGLDWLRIAAFGLLILYHVGMVFVPWDWHIKSQHPIAWLELPMMAVNAWRLPLLFMISGAASASLLRRLGTLQFARSRIARLLPPLLFGMTVIVVPQPWVELRFKHEYTGSLLNFWVEDYFRFGTLHGLSLPTWNHLWFVAYLLIYSLLLATLTFFNNRIGRYRVSTIAIWLSGGSRLLWLPSTVLLSLQLTLYPLFPVTHGLIDDWYNHAESLAMFGFGLLLASSFDLRTACVRQRRAATVFAVSALGVYSAYWWASGDDGAGVATAVITCARVARVVLCWGMIVSLVGHALLLLNHDSGPRRYLTEAVFPFYIAHQTIIVLAAWWLARFDLGAFSEFVILTVATTLGCLLFFELARRSGPLRPLFGLSYRTAHYSVLGRRTEKEDALLQS